MVLREYNQAIQVAQTIENTPYYKASALEAIATQYAQSGQMEQALRIAQTLEMPDFKAKTLTTIAAKYAAMGQQAKASEVFSQAVQIAQTAEAGLLATIAIQYAEAGQRDAALNVVQQIDDAHSKATALTAIALSYTKAGQPTQASALVSQVLETIPGISETYRQAELRQEMIRSFVKLEQYDFALQVTRTIDDNFAQSETLREIAKQAAEALGAVALEYALGNQPDKAAEILSQALQLAQTIEDVSSNSYTLRTIADQYIFAQRYDLAFRVAQSLKEPSERSFKLQEISDKFIESGQYDTALQVVNILEPPSEKARLLIAIAGKYIQTGQKNKAIEILGQAFQVARTIEGSESKFIVLKADYDSEGNIISQTETDDPYDRASSLEEIALKYAQAGQYNQGVQVAQAIEDASTRNQLNQRLACYR